MRVTIIGVGKLIEVIWPIIGRVLGGDDVASRVIGVTADEADLARKEAHFGFPMVLDDNLGALRSNRPDLVLFAPPPTAAPALIESVLRPYYDECRAQGSLRPELYAFPPVPPGSTYLDALGSDIRVVNIIPNNVTSIGGQPIVDEGHYTCTFASPWPSDRVASLRELFAGQGAFVELEPGQLVAMLGGAATISSLWSVVPAVADLITRADHRHVGAFLRARVRDLTGFEPIGSTPLPADIEPPRAEVLAPMIRSWYQGVTRYYGETDLSPVAARTLVDRGLDLVLHTTQVEPREVLDELAVGAATKGGVLERAIRSAREDLIPLVEASLADGADPDWDGFTEAVTATAHTVRRHGMTLAR